MDQSCVSKASGQFSLAVSFQAVSAALLSTGPLSWTVGVFPGILMLLGLEDRFITHPSSPF